jgi:hypothetical protein
MSATLVWLHYVVLCVMPAFALFRARVTAVMAGIALLLMSDVPYEMLFGATNPRMRQPWVVIGFVLLFAGCIWQLWRGRPHAPAELPIERRPA